MKEREIGIQQHNIDSIGFIIHHKMSAGAGLRVLHFFFILCLELFWTKFPFKVLAIWVRHVWNRNVVGVAPVRATMRQHQLQIPHMLLATAALKENGKNLVM
jgi:hypothetical protein